MFCESLGFRSGALTNASWSSSSSTPYAVRSTSGSAGGPGVVSVRPSARRGFHRGDIASRVRRLHGFETQSALGGNTTRREHDVACSWRERGRDAGCEQATGRVRDEHDVTELGAADVLDDRRDAVVDGERHRIGGLVGAAGQVDRQRRELEQRHEQVPEPRRRRGAVDQDERETRRRHRGGDTRRRCRPTFSASPATTSGFSGIGATCTSCTVGPIRSAIVSSFFWSKPG